MLLFIQLIRPFNGTRTTCPHFQARTVSGRCGCSDLPAYCPIWRLWADFYRQIQDFVTEINAFRYRILVVQIQCNLLVSLMIESNRIHISNDTTVTLNKKHKCIIFLLAAFVIIKIQNTYSRRL